MASILEKHLTLLATINDRVNDTKEKTKDEPTRRII